MCLFEKAIFEVNANQSLSQTLAFPPPKKKGKQITQLSGLTQQYENILYNWQCAMIINIPINNIMPMGFQLYCALPGIQPVVNPRHQPLKSWPCLYSQIWPISDFLIPF